MKKKSILLAILLSIPYTQTLLKYAGPDIREPNDSGIQDDFTVLQSFEEDVYLEDTIDSNTYIVGPGDEFAFNMVSSDGVITLPLKVSPLGDVLIPVVGTISVDKLTLERAFEHIRDKCLEKYESAEIYLSLVNLRKFKVLVIGTVKKPGYIIVNPIMRVSDVFLQVGGGGIRSSDEIDGVKSRDVSTRNIKLWRSGKLIRVDLIKYHMFGNKESNPFVQQGDIIEFRLKNEEVGLFGGVELNGKYEFVKNESLYDLIQLAGGFTKDADSTKIEITRFINDTEKQIIQISEISDLSNTVLMPEDHIIVRMKQDYKRQEVITVLGEVKYPGKYALQDHEMTVGKIIEKAGGYASRADRTKIIVNNQSIAKLQDIEFKRIMLVPYEDRSDAEKAYVKARSRTTKGTISSSSQQYTDTIMDFPLQIDDIVFIPPLQEYVELLGAVVYPGRYPLIAGKSIQEYIEDAGGKTKRASRQRYIVKNSTGQRIPFDETDTIENGDVIFIAEKLEYNLWTRIQEVMTVGGQMAAIIIVIQNAVR